MLITVLFAIGLYGQAAGGPEALLAEASQRIAARDFVGPKAMLSHFLKQNPGVAEAQNLLGVCLVELGDPAAAGARFQKAIQLQPGYSPAHLNLASVLLKLGRQGEAVQALERVAALSPEALARDPQAYLMYYLMGLDRARRGQTRQAEKALSTAVRFRPGFAAARLNLGKILLLEKKQDAALEQFEAVPAGQPEEPLALLNAGLIYARKGDYPKASERFAKAAVLVQNNAPLAAQFRALALAQAKGDFERGHYQGTATVLEAVRSLAAQDLEFHSLLGATYYATGDPRRASDEFQQALRLDPDNEQLYFNLGVLFLKYRTPELARLVFEHGLQRLPNSPLLEMGMGLSQHFAERTEQAEASLKRAIALDGGFTDAYVVLGDLLETANRLRDALEVFRKAIRKNPDLYIAYFYYGKILLKLNESREAEGIAALRKAVQLKPDFAEGHYELGRALEQAGNTQEAVAEYQESLAKDASLAQSHYRLALLYRKRGDTARADRSLQAFKLAQMAQARQTLIKRLEYRIGKR